MTTSAGIIKRFRYKLFKLPYVAKNDAHVTYFFSHVIYYGASVTHYGASVMHYAAFRPNFGAT